MIKFSRIAAVMYRHLIPTFRDPMRLTDMAYYPIIDLILFGFLGLWSYGSQGNSNIFIVSLLTSVCCWYLVYRSALEISRNFLVEIWEFSIVNLLATPISVIELILALMILGLIQATITFVYASCLIWLIFSKNIFLLYFNIMLYLPLFVAFGWVIGILTASLIFYFGKSVEFITWAIPWMFGVLSGAFYSIGLLPSWAQKISGLFPLKYTFKAMRESIKNTNLSVLSAIVSPDYIIAFILTIFYLVLIFMFLLFMVRKAKNKGLNNLS